MGVSRLKAQSKQSFDSAIVLRHIKRIMLEFFSRLVNMALFRGKKAVLKINILGEGLT